MPRARYRPSEAAVVGSKRAVFSGQSRNLYPVDVARSTYPHFLMSGRGIPWANIAIAGYSWTNLYNNAGVEGAGHTDKIEYEVTLAAEVHAFLQGGEADITFGDAGDTGQEAYDDLLLYANLYYSAGFATVTVLTTPSSAFFTATGEGHRQDYNALILSDGLTDFDHVVDIDVPPVEFYGGNPFWANDPHQNAAGSAAIAALVAPTADSIFA